MLVSDDFLSVHYLLGKEDTVEKENVVAYSMKSEYARRGHFRKTWTFEMTDGRKVIVTSAYMKNEKEVTVYIDKFASSLKMDSSDSEN